MLGHYIRRLVTGDDTVLSHILMSVEGKRTTQLESLEGHLYQHLVKRLVAEGRRAHLAPQEVRNDSCEQCVMVLRILLTAFTRGGELATCVRKSLLEAGVAGCKAMLLDRYFNHEPWMASYVLNFTVLLMRIYCIPASDILTVQANAENAEQLKSTLDASVPVVLSNRIPHSTEIVRERVRDNDGRTGVIIRSRRELPSKPSFFPFSQNPLYSETDNGDKWMTPQFPTPVILFAKQFGLGCVPKFPNLNTFVIPMFVFGTDLPKKRRLSSLSVVDLRVSRHLAEALDFENNRDPLFSRYLSNGCLLIWGNAVAFQDGDANLASPISGLEVGLFQSYIISPFVLNIPVPVVSFSCGVQCCHLVTIDGNVLSCGSNEFVQMSSSPLSLGKSFVIDGRDGLKLRFHDVSLRKEEKIGKIKAGSTFVVLVPEGCNRMYLWGENSYGQCLVTDRGVVTLPVVVEIPEHYGEVLDVVCGNFFAAVSFSCGSIGTWGLASMLGVEVSDDMLMDTVEAEQPKCAKSIVIFRPINERIVALRAGPCHCLAVAAEGTVYSWGMCRNTSRLGHNVDQDTGIVRRIDSLSSHHVVDASCGAVHSAVLTSKGAVLVFGENTCGQLGIFGEKCLTKAEILPLPKCAIAVSCGREHTSILLEDGDIMICGTLRSSGIGLGYGVQFAVPRRSLHSYLVFSVESGSAHGMAAGLLRNLTIQIVTSFEDILRNDEMRRLNGIILQNGVRTIAGGKGFMILLTETGSALAFGDHQKGQLGIGNPSHLGSGSSFNKVSVPESVQVATLDCGLEYTIGLSTCGGVYSWGSNSHGQLGHGSAVPLHGAVFIPQEVMTLRTARVAQIACGGTFAVALTQDGDVYTWGEGIYCGRAQRDTPCLMQPMILEQISHIASIAAGLYHAVALSKSHVIYTWGKGPLGDGGVPNMIVPTPVAITFVHGVRQLGCGPLNSYVITEIGDLFVWGSNKSGQCGISQRKTTVSSLSDVADNVTHLDSPYHFPSLLLFPTLAASDVRDAAFGLSCGVIIKDDGSSAVTGELYHESGRVFCRSFTPQRLPSTLSEECQDEHRLGPLRNRQSTENRSPAGFFSRCFRGVDMLFTIIEWNRPTAAEVRLAIRNMSRHPNSTFAAERTTNEEGSERRE